ncbi:lysoplasmalogenase family protein [Flavobacterium sp.]|uniref:lysoplasmalogenase family protein n=1 Tax=Flavobacterium sp. TaxID=239 RepID=UPI00286EADEB|nr:lysoplasmalogenase family protein [Flavobacterium sp.]
MKSTKCKIYNENEIRFLTILFFIVSFSEVMAEFFRYNFFIYLLKPLLIPVLVIIYFKSSKVKNSYFITSLFFAFLANILFISKDFNSIMLGSFFYAVYRVLIIYLVVRTVNIKNYFPIFLGCIPFAIIFGYITSLTFNELGDVLYMYFVQVILIIFLSGFALANYMVDDKKRNYWLLVSCLLFSMIQFILVLKIYYLSIFIFQPIAMLLYGFAQYSLYKFIILSEELDSNFSTA